MLCADKMWDGVAEPAADSLISEQDSICAPVRLMMSVEDWGSSETDRRGALPIEKNPHRMVVNEETA